jgi:UDP-glucose 4-epimerase
MKILITGGNGYLGGRLVQYLEKQNVHEVIVGTRQPKGKPDSATTVQTIWDSPEKLQQICTGIDAVIHLAGMNAEDSTANPAAALECNAGATGKIINAAVKQGVKRFIYFSTAHIYKSPLVGLITEETLPTSLYPYATSHRAAEDIVRAAHLRGEIEGVVIRLSNAFGAPVNKEANCWMLLVNDLCKQAVTTGAMVLKSSGIQRRDFITITDVCRATEHLLKLPTSSTDKNIFNVGGNWSPTVWELACLIQQHCKRILAFEPTLERVEPAADVKTEDLNYNIDRLTQTGFTLSSNREEEIDRLLAFCNSSFPNISSPRKQ